MSKKESEEKIKWYPPEDWSFRKNKKRKAAKGSSHPALIVGKKGNQIANVGMTHSPTRGHHKNIELSKNPNPHDKNKSYLRDDLQMDSEKYLKEILHNLQLSPRDYEKVYHIIEKYKKKDRH